MNDPIDQLSRFEAQAKAKKQKHEEKKHARVFIPAEPVADPEE